MDWYFLPRSLTLPSILTWNPTYFISSRFILSHFSRLISFPPFFVNLFSLKSRSPVHKDCFNTLSNSVENLIHFLSVCDPFSFSSLVLIRLPCSCFYPLSPAFYPHPFYPATAGGVKTRIMFRAKHELLKQWSASDPPLELGTRQELLQQWSTSNPFSDWGQDSSYCRSEVLRFPLSNWGRNTIYWSSEALRFPFSNWGLDRIYWSSEALRSSSRTGGETGVTAGVKCFGSRVTEVVKRFDPRLELAGHDGSPKTWRRPLAPAVVDGSFAPVGPGRWVREFLRSAWCLRRTGFTGVSLVEVGVMQRFMNCVSGECN